MIDWLKTNLMVIIFVGVPGIIVLIGIMKGVRNKLQQRLEVDKELTDNESTTSSKNFLKKLSIKRIAKWAFLIFLAIQAVAWILDMPQLFVVKKLVDIAHRNDPEHIQLPVTEALLKSAMMFCEKPDGKRWVLKAEIKKLNEHQLIIYYLYSDECCGKYNVGVIKCLRYENNKSYVGIWRDDARGTAGEIELQPNYANGEVCCFAGNAKESRDNVEIKTEIKTNPSHSHSRIAKN